MKIAAVQMVSTPRVADNLDAARRLVAAGRRAKAPSWSSCPNTSACIGQNDRDKLAVAEAAGDGPIQRMLAETARAASPLADRRHAAAQARGAPGADADDRVMNANLVFSPQGEQVARYDKMHLFAYDNGRERYDEGANAARRHARRSRSTPTAGASA